MVYHMNINQLIHHIKRIKRKKTSFQLIQEKHLVKFGTFFFLRFYLFEKECVRERECKPREEAEGEGEADSPLSREPDVEFYPRALRS